MKLSTGLPNCREGRQNPMRAVDKDAIVRAAVAAEAVGFYSVWPNEFFVSRPDVSAKYNQPPNLFDAIVTMAYALSATEKIRIMPSVLILPLHEPLLLARQIATLDVFSGGRVTLGIGLGGTKEEFERMRRGPANRSKMIAEYVAAMRTLWTEPQASFEGEYVHFDDLESYPKPMQNPLPVLRAGHGDAAIEWIARHGQGWIDSSHTPEEIVSVVDRIRRIAKESGREDVDFEVGRQLYVSVGETQREAEDNFAAALPPPPNSAATAAGAEGTETAATRSRTGPARTFVGTPDQLTEELRKYEGAGVTDMCVIFYSPSVEAAERQMTLFAKEVAPAF